MYPPGLLVLIHANACYKNENNNCLSNTRSSLFSHSLFFVLGHMCLIGINYVEANAVVTSTGDLAAVLQPLRINKSNHSYPTVVDPEQFGTSRSRRNMQPVRVMASTSSSRLQSNFALNDCPGFRNPTLSRQPCFLGSVDTRISVEENEPLLLRCLIYNVNFSTVVITWWREGHMQELTLGLQIHNSRYRIPRLSYQDWSLHIDRARLEDSGVYFCQINLEHTLEKFFHVQVKQKPKPTPFPLGLMEQGFVKDEAIEQHANRRLRIEGQHEGHIGSYPTIRCVSQFSSFSTTNYLIWSHVIASKRIFIGPMPSAMTHFREDGSSSSSSSYRRRKVVPFQRQQPNLSAVVHSASLEHVDIRTDQYENGTYVSQLTFQPLRVEHAGLWKCSKIIKPHLRITEEAEIMVYVRTKSSSIRVPKGQIRASYKHGSTGHISASWCHVTTSMLFIWMLLFIRDAL